MAPKGKNVFERWTPVWHALFYLMIAIATLLAFQNFARAGGGPRALVLALDAVLVAWHVVMLAVVPARTLRDRPRRVAVYLAGATALSIALLRVDLVFLMVAMTLYNHVFAFMTMRWAAPAAALLTLAIAGVALRRESPATAAVLALGSGLALIFALFLRATSNESEQRQALIDELERTRERLALAERLAGRTEERRRIARDLHDTVTQQLVGIVMQLEAAGERDPAAAHDAVASSLRLAREGLAEARRLVWAERPAQLEGAPLSLAIEAVTSRIAKEAGLAIERVVSDDVDELPAAVQTLVLRAVQEALANVRKHARATSAVVTVSTSDDVVAVDVNDDGVGFDEHLARAPRANGAGFGLRGLRERAVALGGSMSIESAPGGGTTLTIHVPRAPKEERT